MNYRYLLLLAALFSISLQLTAQKKWVDAADFGIVANNEQTDNSKPLQEALDYAEKKGVNFIKLPAGTYFISKGFNLKDSISITGAGIGKTILKLMNNLPPRSNEATQTAVFTGRYAHSLSSSTSTRNVTIKSLTIDLQKPFGEFNTAHFSMLGGIRLINPVNCIVDSVEIINPPKFGIGLYATQTGSRCNQNTIRNCKVIMQPDWYLQLTPMIIPRSVESCIGIELSSYVGAHNNGASINLQRNNPDYFLSKTRKNTIQGNTISGGSHGISVSNSSNNSILSNIVSGCSNRGIIIISCSDSNRISKNTVSASGSTAIHLAYDCNFNSITYNTVNGVLGVEGDGIKSYVNCNHNQIKNNSVTDFAKTGIRVSHGANNNSIEYNKITGNGSEGQIGIKIVANNKRQYDDHLTFNDKLTARNNTCKGNTIYNTETGLLIDDEMNFEKSTGNNKTGNNKFRAVKKPQSIRQ